MRGEYAKKGRRDILILQFRNFPSFVTERWRSVLSEVARMFSVDENSSSFFSFLHCCHSRLKRGFFSQ